jgi:hypothetical protein
MAASAIALSMSFIKLSFPHLSNAKGKAKAGQPWRKNNAIALF